MAIEKGIPYLCFKSKERGLNDVYAQSRSKQVAVATYPCINIIRSPQRSYINVVI